MKFILNRMQIKKQKINIFHIKTVLFLSETRTGSKCDENLSFAIRVKMCQLLSAIYSQFMLTTAAFWERNYLNWFASNPYKWKMTGFLITTTTTWYTFSAAWKPTYVFTILSKLFQSATPTSGTTLKHCNVQHCYCSFKTVATLLVWATVFND